jgi:integrase
VGSTIPGSKDHPDDTAGQDTVTVGEAVERYIEDKTRAGERGERRGWSEQSVRNKGSILRDFAQRVGRGRLVEHLTPEDLRSFIYREDLSDSSKRTYHALLSAWAAWLEGRGLPKLEMPGEVETTRRLPSWCSREQLETIIRAFYYVCQADAERNSDPDASFEASRHDDTRWWMQWAWRFCFWQGLRREEVVQIRCGGIDLENRQMVVGDEEFIPKGKREDVIPLSEPAAEIAEEWRRTLPAFSASVQTFSGRQDQPGFYRSSAARHRRNGQSRRRKATRPSRGGAAGLFRLKPDASLPPARPGHGRAIDLIRKRRHVVYVSQFLRHSSLDVTRRYLEVVPRHLHDEIRKLEEEGLDL